MSEDQIRQVASIMGLPMLNNTFVNFLDMVATLKSNAMEELLQQVDWENAGGRKKKIAYLREHNLHVKPENFRAADMPNRDKYKAGMASAAMTTTLTWPSSENDGADPGSAQKEAKRGFGRVNTDQGTSRFVHGVYRKGGQSATDALRVLRTHIESGSMTEGATFLFLDRNKSGELEADDIE